MVDSSRVLAEAPPVFEHRKRGDWGIAIVAWEADGKRAYLFSDGETRVVAHDYYDLMREVVRPQDEIEPLLARLGKASSESPKASPSNPLGFRFEDQLRHFSSHYPDGFETPSWRSERRGAEARRRLKRHRDAAIEQAQRLLGKTRVETLLSEHRHAELWQALLQVAKDTDLVSAKSLAPMAVDEATHLGELAKALRHVLYGDGAFEARLQRFIHACREASKQEPSWEFVTLATALVFPGEHVCIQPGSFREQARWLMPRLARVQAPSATVYRQFLELSRHVQKKLTEANLAPRDLLDVADFIRFTTTPSARKAMLARKREPAGSPASGRSAEAA